MKFLHVGDLHIGKQLNQKSLITDQKHMLNEIIEMMEDNDINILLIAGDIYDKQIPSKEAVKLFNDFLVNAILDHKYKIYIISGNHDSIERLNFASSILKSEGLYIETYGDKFITKYEIKDKFGKVNLFMLPFTTPDYAKLKFDFEGKTYADMIRYYVENTDINYEERNILLTHHTLLHYNEALFSDSELRFNIGGTEGIDASYFENFDYVALGHLHNPQYLYKEHIRYSGSPLKYSESEIKYEKSSVMVELKEKGNITIKTIPFKPIRDVINIKGSITELLADPEKIIDDYCYVTLTDQEIIPYAMKRIKVKYPNAVSLVYEHVNTSFVSQDVKVSKEFHEKDHAEQFKEFFKEVSQNEMNENQELIINKIIKKVVNEDETN